MSDDDKSGALVAGVMAVLSLLLVLVVGLGGFAYLRLQAELEQARAEAQAEADRARAAEQLARRQAEIAILSAEKAQQRAAEARSQLEQTDERVRSLLSGELGNVESERGATDQAAEPRGTAVNAPPE